MTANAPSTDADVTDWLALCHAPGLGITGCHALLDRFGSPQTVRAASSSELRNCGLSDDCIEALRNPGAALEQDLAWLNKPGNLMLTCRDPAYPQLLRELPDRPPLLYIHGNASRLCAPQIAIVGSRNPTASGVRTAEEFAYHLASVGLTVTSGLALGIDTAAHRGALSAGQPTIAVMGTGLDRVYPASNRDLARDIARDGALVSEFPTGTPPLAANFPRRNRIISGLCVGTLVVEAAVRSGSLISARLAAEQGREVFAIPGSIHNPLARGCHYLIRQGAKLVETAQDIIDELGPLATVAAGAPAQAPVTTADEPWQPAAEYMQLLDIIGFEPASVDRLVAYSGLTAAEVSSMLLQLELAGYLSSSPGGVYNRLK